MAWTEEARKAAAEARKGGVGPEHSAHNAVGNYDSARMAAENASTLANRENPNLSAHGQEALHKQAFLAHHAAIKAGEQAGMSRRALYEVHGPIADTHYLKARMDWK